MANDEFQFELRANKEHEDYYLRRPDGTLLGVLDYKNWYSSEAWLTLGERQWVAGSDNFWSTSYSVKDVVTGEPVAVVSFNWKMEAIVHFTLPRQNTTVFVLKSTGFWNYHFTLFHNDTLLMEILPDFRLKKMSYEYEVKGKSFFPSETDNHLLSIVSVYISNLLMTMMASVTTVAT